MIAINKNPFIQFGFIVSLFILRIGFCFLFERAMLIALHGREPSASSS